MKRVLLGLGSNKTFQKYSPQELLSVAREELSAIMSNCVFSSVYRTKAMYVEDQEDFYNMAALGYVDDSADAFDFLKTINNIEAKYGRNRDKEIRFGPRSLDIDIELFGNEVINTETLQIPHIRIEERAFVLVPALEILTESADEVIREKYSACLNKLKAEGKAEGIQQITDFPGTAHNGTERKNID